MDFAATLSLIAAILPPQRRDWAVIGGVAVGLRGYSRATFDMDILLNMDALPRLDEVLLAHGFGIEHRWEETSHYRSPPGRLCNINVLHAHRAYSLAMLNRAEIFETDQGRLTIPVVQTEDLIGLKLQTLVNDPTREHAEIGDLRRLLEAAAEQGRPLERSRVEEYFDLFSRRELLAQLSEGLDGALG